MGFIATEWIIDQNFLGQSHIGSRTSGALNGRCRAQPGRLDIETFCQAYSSS